MEAQLCVSNQLKNSSPSISYLNNDSNEKKNNAAVSYITNLCDDTLLRILSYSDLPSIVFFTRGTSYSLRRRFMNVKEDEDTNDNKDTSYCSDIWREVFNNHNFAPIDNTDNSRVRKYGAQRLQQQDETLVVEHSIRPPPSINYYNAIRERLTLWYNLTGKAALQRRQTKRYNFSQRAKQCFSLPNRMFYFVPIVPSEMMRYPPTSNTNHLTFTYAENSDIEDGNGDNVDMHDDFDMAEQQLDVEEEVDNDNQDRHMQIDDPPPVEFTCDSYCLTSPGTGSEYVLLNPFSGAVEVYANVLDNAVSNDVSLMEQALLDASEGVSQERSTPRIDEDGDNAHPDENSEVSEVIAGEAIHNCLLHHHMNNKVYDTPPKQVLFSVNDYFDLDLNEYFGDYTPFASIMNGRHRQQQRGNVTVDWVGVDSHIALESSNDYKSIAGNMIGAGRILTMESEHGIEEEELACTEIFAWSNFDYGTTGQSSTYDTKYVCRAAGSFYFLDVCANYKRLYASFQSGSCPFVDHDDVDVSSLQRDDRQLMDIEDESIVNDDGQPIRMQRSIYCLPLQLYNETPSSPEEIDSYFPTPDACIVAQYPVSSFSIDPTGRILLVGTTYGTVEVWQTGMDPYMNSTLPKRLRILSVHESFIKRHRSKTMDERSRYSSCNNHEADVSLYSVDDVDMNGNNKPSTIEFDDNATETQDDLALLEDNVSEEEFTHKHPTSKISQVYLPRHMPVHQCGFITKQRNPENGTTLLLWQTPTVSSEKNTDDNINEQFQITAMINLPLAAQCHPSVHFDGRRIIVLGRDHIGQILLVYHVLNTRYDQDEFGEVSTRVPGLNEEESGGVIQITEECRIKFVNRIRHAGLGGVEYFDSMLLSANERFIFCNTKRGNLIGSDSDDGERNASEGLLVIDLQDGSCS